MAIPNLHIGAGTNVGILTLFPVWTSAPGLLGISSGAHTKVSISELASGPQVSKLTARNIGTKPALLLEGELLEGGHQHRVCASDVLLGVGEYRDIDTYCVERGRWGGANRHNRNARRAPLSVRAELVSRRQDSESGGRQAGVWARVSRYQGLNRVSSTSSLVEHIDAASARVLTGSATFPRALEGQRGVIVGFGGEPLMMEVFGTSTLFSRHYCQFAEAALLDAQLFAGSVSETTTPAQAVREFAARIAAIGMAPFGEKILTVRHHGTLLSHPIAEQTAHEVVVGISVAKPKRQPQLAHASAWNTAHPTMASA